MTNTEFQTWLASEFEKYPMLNLSFKRDNLSFNELVHVLRLSGRDMCINTTDPDDEMGFGITPSVVETYIPTRWLVRKVATIKYEEHEEDGQVYPLLCVTYKSAQEMGIDYDDYEED